jgi:hypothetical protein
MQMFVDLRGASGGSYRFRLVAKGDTPLRIAGNYAIVQWKSGRCSVAHLGVTNDLSKMREAPPPSGRGPFHHYIRLNVSRAVREAEHEDMLAGLHSRPRIAAE